MQVKTLILPSRYIDSVRLMQAARDLTKLPGVADAAVVMATDANKSILQQAGLLTEEAKAAGPNDLVIAVKGEQPDAALAEAEHMLQATQAGSREEGASSRPRTLRAAHKANPQANLAVISVAGRYAASEAWEALHAGLHVLLFSDNVSLEDEIALKQYAVEHGLLMMGPGAGTALVNGVGLGFANRVPQGHVGIVSAAGTGLQEVSSLLARYGAGVSQGLGTGGRDLKEAVGGLMMTAGLEALQGDPQTSIIVLVSKPPAAPVARKILETVKRSEKPTVVCFLGGDPAFVEGIPKAQTARTLQEAAYLGALAAGASLPPLAEMLEKEAVRHNTISKDSWDCLAPQQHFIRGLYSGGTLCYETQVIWKDLLTERVLSNAPLSPVDRLPDSAASQGHTVLDLGEEEFTVGRPHPMIDYDLRLRRMLQESNDPRVAVILLDVVLGYGSHPDPASELVPVVRQVLDDRQPAGGHPPIFVASITGTRDDPQGYDRQCQVLQEAGVILCETNASAARLAAQIVSER